MNSLNTFGSETSALLKKRYDVYTYFNETRRFVQKLPRGKKRRKCVPLSLPFRRKGTSERTAWSQQPLKLFPNILWDEKVHYSVKSVSLIPILVQMSSIHTPNISKIHFSTLLLSTFRSPDLVVILFLAFSSKPCMQRVTLRNPIERDVY
jgi:hypothetical protein